MTDAKLAAKLDDIQRKLSLVGDDAYRRGFNEGLDAMRLHALTVFENQPSVSVEKVVCTKCGHDNGWLGSTSKACQKPLVDKFPGVHLCGCHCVFPEPQPSVPSGDAAMNLIEDIEIFKRAKEKMGHIDDKMLLWCLKGTVLLDVPMFSYQSALIDELEDRLFPEYDGDKVTLEDFGWRTPDGLIIYSDVFCTENHSESKSAGRVNLEPYDCCRKCPHCFRHFKRRYYVGHPETCSRNPTTGSVPSVVGGGDKAELGNEDKDTSCS